MGQRSQIYIRYNVARDATNGKSANGLIARYYQWNFGTAMISRARYLLETIADNKRYSFMYYHKSFVDELAEMCDVNFDSKNIQIGLDILKEISEEFINESDPMHYLFDQPNNDGQLLIDITDDEIKYAFISPYEDIAPMNARQYLEWNLGKDWETPQPYRKKMQINTANKNIRSIEKNARLMTADEVEEFLNYDYSIYVKNLLMENAA